MSGGSLDYLCYKDAGEINPEVLAEVVECLGRRGVGFAEAQVATMAVAGKLAEVGRLLEEVEASLGWVGGVGSLRAVWKAVEWELSYDTGPENTAAVVLEWVVELRKRVL